jgi:inner membrane protein
LDNLTHTLAGLLLAEAAVQARAPKAEASAPFRAAAYFASAWVNNAPDLDFVYAGVTERPIGYLLHHRGHSHTVPIGIAIGVVTAVVGIALARRNDWRWSRSDRITFVALCFLGPFVHVAMDFSNNYGVRPFWPAYSGSFYGDAVFIVEPLFWAASIPSLYFAARTKLGRFVLAAVLALGVVACWTVALAPETTRLVPRGVAGAVTVAALGSTLVARRLGPRARVAFAVAASWTVAAIFFAGSSTARATIRRSLATAGHAIHDVVITPLPANPFCEAALVVQTDGDDYVVQRAMVATVPALYPSESCPTAADGNPTAPLSPVAAVSTPAVTWKGEYRAPLRELSDLAHTNCQAAALFRFLRVPYWVDAGPDELVLGDLRYDRRKDLDFSDVLIAKHPARCPEAVPSWIPPRLDLLEPAVKR